MATAKVNKFNLDCYYFRVKLNQVIRDMQHYRPDELARALTRLAFTANDTTAVITAEELQLQKLQCEMNQTLEQQNGTP